MDNMSVLIGLGVVFVSAYAVVKYAYSLGYSNGVRSGMALGSLRGTMTGVYTTLFSLDMCGAISYNEENEKIHRILDNGTVGAEVDALHLVDDMNDPRALIIMDKVVDKIRNTQNRIIDLLIDDSRRRPVVDQEVE